MKKEGYVILVVALTGCNFMGGQPSDEDIAFERVKREQAEAALQQEIRDSCRVISRDAYCWFSDSENQHKCQSTLTIGSSLHEFPVDSATGNSYQLKDIYRPCADRIREK